MKPTIRKSLLQLVFDGSFMKRWNDKHRSTELVEIDKQAHKMIAAWALYQENAKDMPPGERHDLGIRVIEGGLFEYLYRLIITDIKPPVFYQIKANPAHYAMLTNWVLDQLEARVLPLGRDFVARMRDYLSVPEGREPARRILDAAHLYASYWEFRLIKDINQADDEIRDIDASFVRGLDRFMDIQGVPEIRDTSTALGRFAELAGRLRFQKRWSQTPRIPETSVLGHMFIVAAYAYFFCLATGSCPARRINTFFAGLFHDLPELLTRDIISPVKRSMPQIGDIIKEYESLEMRKRVFDPLNRNGYPHLAAHLAYLLGQDLESEFVPSIISDGKPAAVEWSDLQSIYNSDAYEPKDGLILKLCDDLAAFIEAYTALRNGISSDHLQQALWRIRGKYQSMRLPEDLHIGALLADFD